MNPTVKNVLFKPQSPIKRVMSSGPATKSIRTCGNNTCLSMKASSQATGSSDVSFLWHSRKAILRRPMRRGKHFRPGYLCRLAMVPFRLDTWSSGFDLALHSELESLYESMSLELLHKRLHHSFVFKIDKSSGGAFSRVITIGMQQGWRMFRKSRRSHGRRGASRLASLRRTRICMMWRRSM